MSLIADRGFRTADFRVASSEFLLVEEVTPPNPQSEIRNRSEPT